MTESKKGKSIRVTNVIVESLFHLVSKRTFFRAYGQSRHGSVTSYCHGDGQNKGEARAELRENLTLMRSGKWPERSQYDRPDAWWRQKLSAERDGGNCA